MIQSVRLGVRLALGSARSQRARTLAVVVTSMVGTLLVLGVLAIARAERVARVEVYSSVDNQRLLVGVVVAVVFPVLVLAATVGRLAARLRDRRMANLRLLGMGSASVRLTAAVEAGAGAVAGCALGVAAFPALRWCLGRLSVAGATWSTEALLPWWPIAVPAVLAIPLVVVVVAAVPQRLDMVSVLSRARRNDARRPSWLRVAPLLAGITICLVLANSKLPDNPAPEYVLVFFLGLGLLGLGVLVVVPVFVRLLADVMLRFVDRPTLTIAARRLQAQPAGVTRVVSGLLLGLFLVVGARCVLVAFEDTPQYVDAHAGLTQQQIVTVESIAAKAEATEQRIQSLTGVRSTTIPTLGICSAVGDSDEVYCAQVLVASCPQVQRALPQLRGCLPDQAMWVAHSQTIQDGVTVVPTTAGVPVAGAGIHVITRSLPLLRGNLDRGGELSGATLLLPPSTPGISQLTTVSDRSYVVTAAPGRDLGNRLAAAGVNSYSEPDYSYVDFVSLLRTMLWTLASVIISVGLLGFAIAAVDRAVSRRSEVMSLQLVGVPRQVLRRTQWLEAALPIAVGGVLAALVGMAAGATYLSLAQNQSGLPWMSLAWVMVVAVLGGGLVAALTVVASSPSISAELVRHE